MTIIRNYRPSDCPLMAKLFHDTVHTVNARDYTQAQLDAWSPGTVDLEAWNRSFSERDTLVAQIGGELVGFADMDRAGYLDRLYVHRDFQGQGIASALVSELEQRARESGAVRFETDSSITARPFFEKRGYAVAAENKVLRRGATLTNYRMTKRA